MNHATNVPVTPSAPIISRKRAFACLLLNVIVFPGLGTIFSRDPERKRTGMLQLGLGALLIPLLVIAGMGGAALGGADPEVVKAWLGNFVMLLVVWNVMTGVQLLRKSWREAPRT